MNGLTINDLPFLYAIMIIVAVCQYQHLVWSRPSFTDGSSLVNSINTHFADNSLEVYVTYLPVHQIAIWHLTNK